MLIHNKKAFGRGLILLISFIGIFVMFFLPIYPNTEDGTHINGLQYADHMFNTLSKGSSNFFDSSRKDNIFSRIDLVKGKTIDLVVPYKAGYEAQMTLAQSMLGKVGLEAEANGLELHVKGDFYTLMQSITEDAHSMYKNDAETVGAKYGTDGKTATKAWWQLGSNMIKPLQRIDKTADASLVNAVLVRAVEAGYNFYGITPIKVSDNIPLVAAFLIFYVVYTMWYGFAIFELFEGIGLTMKKGKKQEA